MPRRRSRSADHTLSAEINVTSLVDVAFVLLVIFLMTAPIMQAGVEIQVPKARAESIDAAEGVIVTVTADGRTYIGEEEASAQQFRPALTGAVRAEQATNIYLRADENVPYGQVLRVLGIIKEMDIATVGLIAEPENEG